MRAVIGHSDEIEADDAIQEVLEQCRESLGDERPKAAMLFMSVDYDHQVVLDAIAEAWPGLPLIGGTSDGEVSSRQGFVMDSVLLTLLCGDFEVSVGLGRDLSKDISTAVAEATGFAQSLDRPSVALTIFAPSTNASQVVREIDAAIDATACPVLGGLTGDHREFARMVEFCGTEVLRDSLPILYLHGDLTVSWGVGSGWFPIGDAYEVTGSNGYIVTEIAGKPALEIYREYYGEVPEGSLGEYPLAVYEGEDESQWSLRAVLGTDAGSGEVRFAGDVPTGSRVRMTEVLPDGVLAGTTESVSRAVEAFGGQDPQLALLFSCAARKWVLGTKAEEEVGLARDALPTAPDRTVPLAGLYVYGEIAPPRPGTSSTLHNETCVTVLIGSHGRRAA